MSPGNGATSLGHAALDVLGMVPGVGFLFDAANCAWYIRDGEYAMAALSALSAIPGLGDAVSAGKLATKGAKAAELCNMLKKLGYAARIVENAGEIAINVTNMYVDYAIKEKEFSIDTVASGLALGLNVFGIYASAKRYGKFCSETADVGKVTDGIEGGNKVAEKVEGVSGGTELAQYGDNFGKMGIYVENPNIKVDWSQYAEHGFERMQQRGMTQDMVDQIVVNGKVLSQSNGSKFAFITQDGVAVVSKEGKLITTWSSEYYDSNMQEIITKLFGE